jgi:hypothetical protein
VDENASNDDSCNNTEIELEGVEGLLNTIASRRDRHPSKADQMESLYGIQLLSQELSTAHEATIVPIMFSPTTLLPIKQKDLFLDY